MRIGRPKRPLTLTADEQERLQSLAHRARSQPALARRARVVLACAQGLANFAWYDPCRIHLKFTAM